ncbi:hypothetical protein IQ63_45300 [Streptomyces acidiscabies]|uniref:Uncharacterized protein n=1 Tax=Streptomyces acidiscabies TaxID=42234 RepID=A0A0L0JCE2_9ACTN|nr:hypothetical protein IQ63_45300 [Streptomyces acidiscabies]
MFSVAGLPVAEAVLSVVCGDDFAVERHVADGESVAASGRRRQGADREKSPGPHDRIVLSLR